MITIIGRSAAHARMLELVAVAATTDVEVLIHGPSGVGKELYAQEIHNQSARARHPFVPINCGALPPELFENELFGHVSGAFTGARTRATGLVSEAQHGTLFLDEVDALPLASQVKLLRLVQQKEYRPLGDSRLRRINVRIIAATNAHLMDEVRAGRFRWDLFFRLRVFPLKVAALKDRKEDVPLLLAHFVQRYAGEYGKKPISFSEGAQRRLSSYDWPGNIRELENCARYLLCMCNGTVVEEKDLPLLELNTLDAEVETPQARRENFNAAKKRVVSQFERSYVEGMLLEHEGNVSAAARASGKHRRAFFELMRRHGLDRAR